jgi:hypothetical protein
MFTFLVHTFCILLASGAAGANRLPVRLAVAPAVPHRGRRRPRGARDHLRRNHAPVQAAGGAISDLKIRRPSSIGAPTELHSDM